MGVAAQILQHVFGTTEGRFRVDHPVLSEQWPNHIKRISENFNVQFRVEMFNILNHTNSAPPQVGDGNTDLFDATGATLAPSLVPGGTAGVLLRTTIPERQIQFAIKIIF